MAAKDLIHEPVRKALENDGWTVTNDPLTLRYRDKRVEIDLGAERWLIGAERANEKLQLRSRVF